MSEISVLLIEAGEKLVAAIMSDNSSHGGLVSRETIRKSDELRMLLLRWRKWQGERK